MKKFLFIIFSLFFFNSIFANDQKIQNALKKVKWLGVMGSIQIKHKNKMIYIDPYGIKKKDKADAIFITHDHFDHLSMRDLKKIAYKNTRFYVSPSCKLMLEMNGYKNIKLFTPGVKIDLWGVHFKTVPAYNLSDVGLHPKNKNYFGLAFTISKVKFYYSSDTDRIPEMKNINCDVAFLPLAFEYMMYTVKEVAKAAGDVQAKVVIPFHYGKGDGKIADALKLKAILEGKVKVILVNKK